MLWRALNQISPISDYRKDVHAAQIAAAVYQSQGAKISINDVLINWKGEVGGEEQSEEDRVSAYFKGLM